MNDQDRIAIIGVGYEVPANIRTNDDPIFEKLKGSNGEKLFQGYNKRRVLAPDERLMDIMVPAALQAIDNAGLRPKDIDVLLGCASVSQYITPNDLAHLHAELRLRNNAWVIPTNDEYANFLSGVMLANALIQAGWAKNALIVCGCNWTRYVDYTTPESVSASDGAGAAVIGHTSDSTRFKLIDAENDVQSQYYGVMYMQAAMLPPEVIPPGFSQPAYTSPVFHITPAGFEAFQTFGEQAPPAVVSRLLERNKLSSDNITLIGHQVSAVLTDIWQKAIKPGQYINTIDTFANMGMATIPVDLTTQYDTIKNDYLVLLSLGPQLQTSALLLQRSV